MAQRPITTADATISTATVEIRTLTVSGKRMSLAVFRQLPYLHPFLFTERYEDPPGWAWCVRQQDGEVWGWVNYHAGCDFSQTGEHLHLVVVRLRTLYQAVAYKDPAAAGYWPFHDTHDQYGHRNGYAHFEPGTYKSLPVSEATTEAIAKDWADAYEYLEALPQLYVAT